MKKRLLKLASVISLAILFPTVSFAEFVGLCPVGSYNNGAACVSLGTIGGILYTIQGLLGAVLPILVSLGVIYFIWGVVQYFINDSEEAKTQGKDRIIYGIIGLAVIVGMWGLVNILTDTFFQGQNLGAPEIVQLPIPTGTSCTLEGNPKVQDLLCYLTRMINDSIIPLLFALAVVLFVWGTINFLIINADEEAKREQGKQFMLWGIIALTVMISVWGLVSILATTFGFKGSVLPRVCPSGDPSCSTSR